MAALYLQTAERARFAANVFSELGIRVDGPVLRGEVSVADAQQSAQFWAQRRSDVDRTTRELEIIGRLGQPGVRW